MGNEMRKQKTVRLSGGSRDGETTEAYAWQRIHYASSRITPEERAALAISDTVGWKPPEDVYVRDGGGGFTYSRTVHYAPKNAARLLNERT